MDFKAEIIRVLEETKAEIINNIDTQKVKASGRTQKSLAVEDRGESIVLVQLPHEKVAPFTTLQFGREGGKVPMGFAKIIEQWLVDKKIKVEPIPYIRKPSDKWQPKYTPVQRGLMQRAGAIANKIAKEGTQRHKTPNMEIYTQPLNKALQKIADITIGSITTEVKVKK